MNIKKIMSTAFTIIAPETTLRKAAELMRDGDFGYLPVGHDDRLDGTVTDRDLVVRGLAQGLPLETPVSQILTDDIVYCYDDESVQEAAELMRIRQIRRLVVLNRDRRMVGVVSVGDIARGTGQDKLTGKIETAVAQPVA
jgi:CBS domain-containing protein